ncbi:MAG TPA: cell wall-binding repeat-containing protein [Solirubrobacteraceae bacterium]|nr:cell wall-binding repeat-containing protein [Solirubrobacteraceae bacterium]
MRSRLPLLALLLALGLPALGLSACGGTTLLHQGVDRTTTVVATASGPAASPALAYPLVATKNTTRVVAPTPAIEAAQIALAVYPSAAPGTHPGAVALAPSASWQAAIAASVLMAPPIRAPILFSGAGALPGASASALSVLKPTGAGTAGGAQVIRIGSVAHPPGLRSAAVNGSNPYDLAAGIDRFVSAAAGKASSAVVVASASSPAYAMPAAGWAAESGDPILFVGAAGVPAATRQALESHQNPHIYVLGPPSVISNATLAALRRYGKVKRVGATGPAANSVAFAEYRDPPCPYGQPCAHVPGSFGWALRSPGHGYVLLNADQPLAAAAAAALSGSGSYGPDLVLEGSDALAKPILDYFLNYATPGYTQEGPTAAVYNHGWLIGDQSQISLSVQAEVDNLLEAVPQSTH